MRSSRGTEGLLFPPLTVSEMRGADAANDANSDEGSIGLIGSFNDPAPISSLLISTSEALRLLRECGASEVGSAPADSWSRAFAKPFSIFSSFISTATRPWRLFPKDCTGQPKISTDNKGGKPKLGETALRDNVLDFRPNLMGRPVNWPLRQAGRGRRRTQSHHQADDALPVGQKYLPPVFVRPLVTQSSFPQLLERKEAISKIPACAQSEFIKPW